MEHDWTLKKKNEALSHSTTWMGLENFMLHERSQPQKDPTTQFHSHGMPLIGESIATASMKSCQSCGVMAKGNGTSF